MPISRLAGQILARAPARVEGSAGFSWEKDKESGSGADDSSSGDASFTWGDSSSDGNDA
jgi:hypothetical protein